MSFDIPGIVLVDVSSQISAVLVGSPFAGCLSVLLCIGLTLLHFVLFIISCCLLSFRLPGMAFWLVWSSRSFTCDNTCWLVTSLMFCIAVNSLFLFWPSLLSHLYHLWETLSLQFISLYLHSVTLTFGGPSNPLLFHHTAFAICSIVVTAMFFS